MKTKDDILLEQVYSKILNENNVISSDERQWYFDDNGQPPYNVKYSNKTFNVRGKEVLIKQELDRMKDDEWSYLSLVDPERKERVFHDITEDQIKKNVF